MPEYRKISVKSPSISAEISYHHKGRVLVKVLAQIFEDLDLDHRRVAVLWDVPHHLDRHPAILLRAGVSAPTRDQTQRARSGPGECRSTARPSRRCLPPHGSVKDQRQREREAAQWPHAPVPSCFSTLSAQEATGAQRGQQREGLRTTAARGGGAGAEGAHSGPRAFRPSPRGSAPPRRKTSWQERRPQRRCPRAISAQRRCRRAGAQRERGRGDGSAPYACGHDCCPTATCARACCPLAGRTAGGSALQPRAARGAELCLRCPGWAA